MQRLTWSLSVYSAGHRSSIQLLDDEGMICDKVCFPSSELQSRERPNASERPSSHLPPSLPPRRFPPTLHLPALALQLYNALSHIFSKYCTAHPTHPAPSATPLPSPQGALFPPPPPTSYLSDAGLDAFATETNGSVFDKDTKDEIREFFDLDEETGGLTMKVSDHREWAGEEVGVGGRVANRRERRTEADFACEFGAIRVGWTGFRADVPASN